MRPHRMMMITCLLFLWGGSLTSEKKSLLPLDISIKKVLPTKISFSKITMKLTLEVNNPTWMRLHYQLQECRLYKEDVLLGKIQSTKIYDLPPKKSIQMDMVCQLSIQKVLDSALSFLFKKKIDLQLQGEMKTVFLYLFTTKIPFKQSFSIDLSKTNTE